MKKKQCPRIVKITKLDDSFLYSIEDHNGWSLHVTRDLNEAIEKFKIIKENFDKYGGDREEVIIKADDNFPSMN